MKNTLKDFLQSVQHGNIINALLYRLTRLGIIIDLYYFIRQGKNTARCPEQKKGYTVGFLSASDMKAVSTIATWPSHEEEWLALLKKGKKCFAAIHNNQIVAFTWISFDTCSSEWGTFELKKNEAYLFALYTKQEFRGRRIAKYLSAHCYHTLRAMGRTTLYSYNSFFNRSAIKHLKRANAEFLSLKLYIQVFNLYKRHLSIKDFMR